MSAIDKLKPAARPFAGKVAGIVVLDGIMICWPCIMVDKPHGSHDTVQEAKSCAQAYIDMCKSTDEGISWMECLIKNAQEDTNPNRAPIEG